MKKRFKTLSAIFLAVACVLSVFAFVGCGSDEGGHQHTYSSEWTTDDTHHWHAATCEHTDKVKDKGAHEWDETTGSCKICGAVKKVTGTGDTKAEFYLNDGTDAIYTTNMFNSGEWVTKPADPKKENKFFAGWYTDTTYATAFNFNNRYESNQSIYARWYDIYTFEAEYTQLTGLPLSDRTAENGNKLGQAYSNNPKGLALINPDNNEVGAGASNGYYVSSLYYNGAFLEFVVNSDREVTDAHLIMRLSAEYFNIELSSTDFLVTVRQEGEAANQADTVSHGSISFTNVITEMNTVKKRPFTNHTITTSFRLEAGKNIIRFQVNNSEKQGTTGTVDAKAPMIDCMYIYTDAALTWDPYLTNISK